MPPEFHFLRPLWLLALIPLALLLWGRLRANGDADVWRRVVDPHLLSHLLRGDATAAARLPLVLLAGGWLLLVIALAGPTWQRLPTSLYQAQQFRVIALDLSPSMHASDVKPSRLARARFELLDLLNATGDGQTAVIAYGSEPYIVSPLTGDAATIAAQVPLLDTGLLPVIGERRTDLALTQAADLLRQAGAREGEVILITDSIHPVDKARDAAQRLWSDGHRVSVLAIGTAAGAPVRLADGGLLKGPDGTIVLPRLDADALAAVAAAGGGRYVTAAVGDDDIALLLNRRLARATAAAEKQDATTERWREEGPWLLLLLLPLEALAFRRGWFSPLPLLLLFVLPPPEANAGVWEDLWWRSDQQAMHRLQSGDADQAKTMFERPDWRAAAAYQSGDYAGALETLDGIEGGRAAYNRGNALARLGRLEDAVTAYDDALRIDPSDPDTRFNRELVQSLLQAQLAQQQRERERSRDDEQDQDKQQDSSSDASDTGQAEQQSEQGDPSDKDQAQAGEQQDTDSEQQTAGQRPDGQQDNADQRQDDTRQQDEKQSPDATQPSDTSQQRPDADQKRADEGAPDGEQPDQDELAAQHGKEEQTGQQTATDKVDSGEEQARQQEALGQSAAETGEAQASANGPGDEPGRDSDNGKNNDGERQAQQTDEVSPPVHRSHTPSPIQRPGMQDLLSDRQQQETLAQRGDSERRSGGDGDEDSQALEQLLRQVEDDPGGLLRQRFLLQHLQRQGRLPK